MEEAGDGGQGAGFPPGKGYRQDAGAWRWCVASAVAAGARITGAKRHNGAQVDVDPSGPAHPTAAASFASWSLAWSSFHPETHAVT